MKDAMKMYVMKGSILPKEESEVEKDQMKENWTSKKDLSTLLKKEEKVQWEEVGPRNQEKRKRPLEKRASKNDRERRHRGTPRSRSH